MFPDVDTARQELKIAGEMNPGPWIAHSLNVAEAARRIAGACAPLDSEKAFVCGLLHDIGPVSYTHLDVYKRQVHYRDLQWREGEMALEGDLSELLQHECDHLDGVLATMRAQSARDLVMDAH